jgi:hypothetical protein
MKILVISTTTQFLEKSTSVALADVCVHALKQRCVDPQVRFIDASKLHIVENLSCYASGEFKCADPKSGPYRCWAHELSMKNPNFEPMGIPLRPCATHHRTYEYP